ncbi:MAG: septal ring lytic transglycosylase RlpA family protein [Myxococcota bacterium]|nr:septal ring lytic transglycosylase RlpA family protein [Myxococcota bacterium]
MKPSFYTHIALLFALIFLSSACATSPIGPTANPGQTAIGYAVYYSDAFQGKRTASGEPYNKDAMTAAHPSLPMGTLVRVTELTSRKSLVVRINDRGPFGDRSRIIDLSHAAAEALGMVRLGKAMVEVEVVELP